MQKNLLGLPKIKEIKQSEHALVSNITLTVTLITELHQVLKIIMIKLPFLSPGARSIIHQIHEFCTELLLTVQQGV